LGFCNDGKSMTRIAFILLCHKDPEAVIAQAARLTAQGDAMAIHFDARAPNAAYALIEAGVAELPNVILAPRRVACGWGEWSLVEATLIALKAAEVAFADATHFYMLSGDCMPVKSAAFAHKMLEPSKTDYIESVDYYTSGWIKTGMQEDRLIYRHWFNERTQPRRFYAVWSAQKRLGLTRQPPADLRMMIGSQWWCLRRSTVETLLAFIAERPDITRFFRTTWIPDETFFQTIVRHLVADTEIDSRTQTFLTFTDYGMPATFYNDHYELLLSQDFLFARKISPEAADLKERLGMLWSSGRTDFEVSNEGRKLHSFLTQRGRIGRRFAPRFWETESSIGRDRELLIFTCRKWHVAKRLLSMSRATFDLAGVAYLFNEQDADLPDLGGIERSVDKRMRHRRALLRMLYDYHGTDRLAICLDPSALELMRDFFSDKVRTRMLEINCNFSDDFLLGHAKRIGLAGQAPSADTIARLLPTLHQEVALDQDRMREAGFSEILRIDEAETPDHNAGVLVEFFRIPWDQAYSIASDPNLFKD
jgi:hypothetical protein